MKLLIFLTAVLSICYHHQANSEQYPRRARTVQHSSRALSYKDYLKANSLFRKYYHSQFNPKLVKGKCKQTPIWSINGTYPVIEEVNKGNAVFLFTMKRSCGRCWSELESLHDWAKYFKTIGAKAKIIALLHKKYGVVSEKDNKRWFPYIKIYNEPQDKNIFGILKAGIHDILMYDKCGRHQYHYGLPYSTLVYQFVSRAMKNTINHYITFCGPCKPLVFPTNSTVTEEEAPPTERSLTDLAGPVIK